MFFLEQFVCTLCKTCQKATDGFKQLWSLRVGSYCSVIVCTRMLHVDFVSWICVKHLLQAEILSFPFERSLRHIHIVKTHKLVCNQTEILCLFIAEKIIRQIACLYQRKAWFGKKKNQNGWGVRASQHPDVCSCHCLLSIVSNIRTQWQLYSPGCRTIQPLIGPQYNPYQKLSSAGSLCQRYRLHLVRNT